MRNIGKWIGSAICALLLLVDATMARSFHGSTVVKSDIKNAVGDVGGRLPDFTLPDIDGNQIKLSQFYSKGPVLLTFDRSLDW